MDKRLLETLETLDGLIDGIRKQMETEPPKPTVSDYLRLVQLRLELGKEAALGDRRPLQVRWVEDDTATEPEPDPNLPWDGDEPLA